MDYKLLREEQTDEYHISLYTGEENTVAVAEFKRIDEGCELPESVLNKLLDDAGVVYGIDELAIKELSEKSASGELSASEEKYPLATGKNPAHGEDGRIEYLVEPSPEVVSFEVEDEETIDYKNTNLIQNVSKEQHLATVIQPEEAENGLDIFGNPVVAREGEILKVKIGANLVMDNNKIYSSLPGRFINENEELSINPVYQVRGDVDLNIGNINFIGSVSIQKDILDDFSVYGKEGVEVGGIVGAASVESDSWIKITGGMSGKGKGFLRAQGEITSKYFNDSTVVSWKDIEVSKSIMNSTIKTKGKLSIPTGSIIGGEVTALMGIDVGMIGSDLGTATSIFAGVDYELRDKLRAYDSQLLEISQEVGRIERILGPILGDKPKMLALPLEKKKAIKGLLTQLKALRGEQTRIREESESFQNESAGTSVKEIKVRKVLYSGVRVSIGSCKRMIKMEIKGPVRLREDLENDTISITNLQL